MGASYFIPAEFLSTIFARANDIDVAGNIVTVVNVNVPNEIQDAPIPFISTGFLL